MKNKGLIIIIVILLLVIVAGGVYIANDKGLIKLDKIVSKDKKDDNKKDEKQEEKEEVSKIVALSTNRKAGTQVGNIVALYSNEDIVTFDVEAFISSNDTWVLDNNDLYYSDTEFNLHVFDVNKKEDKKLDIKLEKDFWAIFKVNDKIITFGGKDNSHDDIKTYDLKTKEVETLNIKTNYTKAVGIDKYNSLFYRNKDGKLHLYNFDTKKDSIIYSGNAQIAYIDSSEENVFFYDDSNSFDFGSKKLYKYDVNKNKMDTLVSDIDYKSFFKYDEEGIYYAEGNSIRVMKDKKDRVIMDLDIDISFNYPEINGAINIDDNSILYYYFIETQEECTSEICGPSGYNKFLKVNLDRKQYEEFDDYFFTKFEYVVG